VFDPISARIAQQLEFDVGILAGSVASMVVLGAPDLIILTLSELVAQAHRICRAAELPLIVDADHGYGNALNVARTVEELERVGVSAVTLEDTLLPAPFGRAGAAQLVSIEEGVGKMRAALEARRDRNLAIIGRTSAMGDIEIEEVVSRARAYEAAGVDAIFVVGVKTKAQLKALSSGGKCPLVVANVGEEIAEASILVSTGYDFGFGVMLRLLPLSRPRTKR
jgi:oxaloacetate decarboxylase